jgi:hypothetical protein
MDMVAYCPECRSSHDKVYRYQKEKFEGNFSAVKIGFICLNCGSLIEFVYDLAEVKLIEKGSKNLTANEKKEIRQGLKASEPEKVKPEIEPELSLFQPQKV